jgi:hypothetical protein
LVSLIVNDFSFVFQMYSEKHIVNTSTYPTGNVSSFLHIHIYKKFWGACCLLRNSIFLACKFLRTLLFNPKEASDTRIDIKCLVLTMKIQLIKYVSNRLREINDFDRFVFTLF